MTSSPNTDNEQLSIDQHPDIKALRGRYALLDRTVAATALHGLVLMAGTYAAISPWVVGFHAQNPLTANDLIVGIAIALLAFTAMRERTEARSWVCALMGIWLIVSPWAVQNVDRTTGVLVSNIVVGAFIVLAGAAAAALGVQHHSRS